MLKLFWLLVIFVGIVAAENYFFILTYHKSHWSFQLEIAQEIYNRGNNVTFLLPLEYKESNELPKLEDISYGSIRYAPIGFTPEEMQHFCKLLSEVSISDIISLIRLSFDFFAKMGKGFEETLTHVTNLIEKDEIDVLVGDISSVMMVGCKILHKYSNGTCFYTTPFVLRNPDAEGHLGKNSIPVWVPVTSVGKGYASTFFERIAQQLHLGTSRIIGYFLISWFFDPLKGIMEKYEIPQENLIGTSLHPILVNSFQGLDWNIPIGPHVKYIGPRNLDEILQIKDISLAKHQKYLDTFNNNEIIKDTNNEFSALDHFLEENSEIVIISFGKSVELSTNNMLEIIEFIRKMENITFLWTLRERHLSMLPDDLPTNLRIETWVNLIGVLSHPHTILLISQCGVATAHESILTQTPLLCIPFLFDQFDISVLIQKNQLGDFMEKEKLTSENLFIKLTNDILPNVKTYKQNTLKFIELAKLKPSIGNVVDWMQTISNIGEDMVLPSINPGTLAFYEFYELYYILPLVFIFILYASYKCCCLCSKRCCKRKNKIKTE